MDIGEILEKLAAMGRPVIFLGDGVPVYLPAVRQELRVEYRLAPAGLNRQRAASIASLGGVYFRQGRSVDAGAHRPEYLRMSQAEQDEKQKEACRA